MTERRDEAALDDALARIHQTSAVWRGELANHAPMAAEALVDLGRPEAIGSFLDVYSDNLEPAPEMTRARLDDWTAALGERDAAPLLTGHFLAAVDERGVDPVVDAALPVLFEGVLAGSLHGLLRLAHALRAWSHRETDLRAREVAHALGYWASEHSPLPGDPGARPEPGLTPAKALAAIPSLPEERWVDGIMTVRAQASARYEPFLAALPRVDFTCEPIDTTLAALTTLAASLFLNTDNPRARFSYLHAITATSALRQVLPRLAPKPRRMALRHHWHALAASQCMTSTLRTASERGASPPPIEPVDTDQLVDTAVASHNDHAIKLAAAALTEGAHHDVPRVRMAAWAFASAAAIARSSV
jgi:Questin oxidase-like